MNESKAPTTHEAPVDSHPPSEPGSSESGTPANFADAHPPLQRDNPLPVKHMPGHFAFETDPTHPRNPFPGQSVERWSPEKLEQHRVVVDENGLLRNTDGSLFDTTGAKSHWTPDGGRAIFIMDRHGNIYASLEQERGRLHHSTLASGNPVTGAGELSVINGRLVEVTGNSGHYMPGRTNTQNVIDELARQGIDIRSITVEWIAPEGT